MPRPMKVRDIIKLIEEDGWYLVRTKGSHRHFRHPTKLGTVTIPGHFSDTVAPKTQKSSFEQAQLEVK